MKLRIYKRARYIIKLSIFSINDKNRNNMILKRTSLNGINYKKYAE